MKKNYGVPKGILTVREEDFDSLCRLLSIPVRVDYKSDREYDKVRSLLPEERKEN